MAQKTKTQRKASDSGRKPKAAKVVPARKVLRQSAVAAEGPDRKLASSWQLSIRVAKLIRLNWQFFGLMLLAYIALDLLLVRSVSVFDVGNIQSTLGDSLQHGAGQVDGSFSVFSVLFTSAATGASAAATGAYHFMVITLVSLATIWALRQMHKDTTKPLNPSVKLAFYNGPTPLIPSLILLLFLLVQFVPVIIGNLLFSLAVQGGVAKSAIEQILFSVVVIGMVGLTMYWIARTVIALYIVTLPGTMPLTAYREARAIIKGHRLSIIRKLLFLPFALFVVMGVVTIPFILIWAPLAQWLFFVVSLAGLLVMQTYLFALYRELLDD